MEKRTEQKHKQREKQPRNKCDQETEGFRELTDKVVNTTMERGTVDNADVDPTDDAPMDVTVQCSFLIVTNDL